MARVERFEDLIAWQKARELAGSVYELTRAEPCSRDFGWCGQIQRAAVSVMANFAEGMERTGSGEFHHFLTIAKASCAEVRSHLYIGSDIGYLPIDVFHTLMERAEETGRVIGGLRASVARARIA